jgi:hypothetical protein
MTILHSTAEEKCSPYHRSTSETITAASNVSNVAIEVIIVAKVIAFLSHMARASGANAFLFCEHFLQGAQGVQHRFIGNHAFFLY